jgi:rhodanese-related sulfurtransferase
MVFKASHYWLSNVKNQKIMKTINYNDFVKKVYGDHPSVRIINAMNLNPSRGVQIPNSLNFFHIEEIEQELSKDAEIIVYCTNPVCNQSINMYYLLEQLGYKNVTRYAGGLMEWTKNGQPLEEIRTFATA